MRSYLEIMAVMGTAPLVMPPAALGETIVSTAQPRIASELDGLLNQ